jgi:hypothetical protein
MARYDYVRKFYTLVAMGRVSELQMTKRRAATGGFSPQNVWAVTTADASDSGLARKEHSWHRACYVIGKLCTRKEFIVKSQHKKSLIAAALLAGGLVYGPMVSAGPSLGSVNLVFPDTTADPLFPASWDTMEIFFDNKNGSSRNVSVRAGMFSGNVDSTVTNTFDVKTLYKDEENVLVYCVDILQNLMLSSTEYQAHMISRGQVEGEDVEGDVRRDFNRMLTFLGAVNHVLEDDFNLGYKDKNWLNPLSNGWMAGAIQLGLWESLYEKKNVDLSITSDDNEYFHASYVHADGQTLLADAFELVNMNAAMQLDPAQLVWLVSGTGQDLLADPISVPTPAPLVLLVGGLGVLVMRRRRLPVASV